MTQDEIDILWQKAMQESIKDGQMYTRYHFAKLVAEAEREAFAKIQFESILQAIKIEREACKQIIRETPLSNWFQADVIEAINKWGQA